MRGGFGTLHGAARRHDGGARVPGAGMMARFFQEFGAFGVRARDDRDRDGDSERSGGADSLDQLEPGARGEKCSADSCTASELMFIRRRDLRPFTDRDGSVGLRSAAIADRGGTHALRQLPARSRV